MSNNIRNSSTQDSSFRDTQKFTEWCTRFYDKSDRECYGNATQSALKVYDTINYNSASVIGSNNLRKARALGAAFAEKEGFGFGELLKIGIAKAIKGTYQDWDRLMVRLGYFTPDSQPINVQNNQINFDGDLAEAIARSRRERGLP